MSRVRSTVLGLTIASLGACISARQPPVAPQSPESNGLFLTGNLGDIKPVLIAYHDGGNYEKDLEAVDAAAEAYLIERASKVTRPALVLDIDETSLSNWAQIVANDFGYFADAPCDHLPKGPCGSIAWDARALSPAISSTLKLAQAASTHQVTIFFITGRYEAERAATETNLRDAKFPQWETLYMRPNGVPVGPAAAYKAPIREQITKLGYTIIVNVGDQPSDLAGGFSERTFLLPNPFYRIK
jgi:acid phosphatase